MPIGADEILNKQNAFIFIKIVSYRVSHTQKVRKPITLLCEFLLGATDFVATVRE
jgi:hypothetical protein